MFKAVQIVDAEIASAGENAAEVATKFSWTHAENVHKLWTQLYGELFVTYVDGYKVTKDTTKAAGYRKDTVGWADEMKAAIADRSGEKYQVPEVGLTAPTQKFAVIDKFSLRALGGGNDQWECKDSEEQVVV